MDHVLRIEHGSTMNKQTVVRWPDGHTTEGIDRHIDERIEAVADERTEAEVDGVDAGQGSRVRPEDSPRPVPRQVQRDRRQHRGARRFSR